VCALLALVGALPVAAGAVVRSEPVRRWAASETAALVERLVGVDASYRVSVQVLPLKLVLEDVTLRSSDGGGPAFTARRIAVAPRLFSLLAGRIDAGDVEVLDSHARIVLRGGELANVKYRLPPAPKKSTPLERAPFASLSLDEARVSLDIDGVRVESGPIDLDVFGEAGPALEVALRIGESRAVRERTQKHDGSRAVDEDVLCELDGRFRIEKGTALVRRLSIVGSADADPAPGTFGSCKTGETDPGRVAVRLSEVRVVLDELRPVLFDGHVVLRAPLAIANRFVKGPFRGWIGAVADVRYDVNADLPELRGKVRGGGVEMAEYRFAKDFDADVEIGGGEIRAKTVRATYGHATVLVEGVSVRPLAAGVPIRLKRMDARGLRFPDLMENCGVTDDTIVEWNLDKTILTDFGGTIDPLRLDGDVVSDTTGFEVFDRSHRAPDRKHMIGVHAATVRTRFGVRPDAVVFGSSRSTFGSSELFASVSVGFDNDIRLSVTQGSRLDLSDVSPLVDIPMRGSAELTAQMSGPAATAELTGDLKIVGFDFSGFPIGDIDGAKVRFKPLVLDLVDVHGTKGSSRFVVPGARLDFDASATLLVDAAVKSDRFDLRDFFAMWHFDEDPRFDDIAGRGTVDARVHYDMGGREDRCGTGYLRVDGGIDLSSVDLFEEHFDAGSARFDYRWMDEDASYLGMQLDAPSVTLKKGSGTLLGSVHLGDGATVRGHFVGSAVPLGRIDAFGDLGRGIDGQVNAVAEVSGTLDALAADVDARVGPTRIGRFTLPGSDLRVHLEPNEKAPKLLGKTKCGRPKPAPFDPNEYAADAASGVFHASGQLFAGQVAFTDLAITRQDHKVVRGTVVAKGLDLGALAELSPVLALSDQRLDGRLSATLAIAELPMDRAALTSAAVDVEELRIGRAGLRVELDRPAKISVKDGKLLTSGVTIATTVPTGERALFDVDAKVDGLGRSPQVDATLTLRPADLAAFAKLFPQAERVSGTLGGSVRVAGTWPHLSQRGRFTLERGELALRGAPVTLTGLDVAIGIDPDEIRLLHAKASVGGGTVEVRGGAPLKGLDIGAARAAITARNVSLPIMDGVRSSADADLELGWQPSDPGGERTLPKLTGDVTLNSFRYTRKVTVAADIDTLTRRGHRTHFEAYDPEDDVLDLDVRIRASRPLEIDNDLVEAKLEVEDPGLVLSGTNQRFGMRGQLAVVKGGRIKLRRNEFDITQGLVRFDDQERIAPQVDVTAVTDYHRYDDNYTASTSTSTSGASSGSGATGSTPGGRWRITMHAYGDPDTLRIDLSSEPSLSQDDIFLLLTLGLTRAELDRTQSATAGSSVALEALGRLTGADEAVTDTIPVIDEFKLGSAYSSRTGRTEPTVTIGKRLAQRIRAYVTSGLTESREVRSNLQFRVSPKVSVEGSYDNVNDISSSALGNLGADIHWRLEFE
jgi:translocation and assembly module TamB